MALLGEMLHSFDQGLNLQLLVTEHQSHEIGFFTGMFVDGQVLTSVEANSSPSSVVAIKGSSVWLHWNYTYLGDGNHGAVTSYYNEQLIRCTHISDGNIQVVAKRIGQNGALTLQSSISAPFNGRLEVISTNSTLAIHRVQYNDSSYQFSSIVNVSLDVGLGPNPSVQALKPTVSITINGMKFFIFVFHEVLVWHSLCSFYRNFS